MIPKAILNLVEICSQKHVDQIIVSPGSRNAPLTLAFARHGSLSVRVISDERSAGYIALGVALETKKPTVLVCTSGTAALNYAPAIAEAYFQRIPLLILTADRPPEWIEQQDGQTIYQRALYGKHVKKSYQLATALNKPVSEWQSSRIINEAINLSLCYPPGPVHINVPLREPLYPNDSEIFEFDKNQKIISLTPNYLTINSNTWGELLSEWDRYKNKLILAGQQSHDPELSKILSIFCKKHQVPLITEITSNLDASVSTIQHCDLLLHGDKPPPPDLLITFGLSVLSKNLKLFLRSDPPQAHWHLAPDSQAPDTFQSLTRVVPTTASYFFQELNNRIEKTNGNEYLTTWKNKEAITKSVLDRLLSSGRFSELNIVNQVVQDLPNDSYLMLANSMPVRWANMVGLATSKKNIRIFANRGTGGIDGSNSTAVGLALASGKMTVLITGDMAFFYDRNAFWHQYSLPNLRIVVLNNHGGVIFRLIDGPSHQPELQNYFETNQTLLAENTAKDFNFEYTNCADGESLQETLKTFFSASEQAKLLELTISKTESKKTYNELKHLILKTNE